MCIRDRYSHTRYVSYNSSSSTCTRSNTTERYCFLRLLAAVVRSHRTGTCACSRCAVVYPWTWSRLFLHRYFCSGIFFSKSTQTLDFFSTSIQTAAAWQRRDSIRGWLHHRRSVAVRSDAWVMVKLLHLGCIQRNEWSRRTFVA